MELDTSKWVMQYWGGGSHWGELGWAQPHNILVQDGILRLRAQEEPIDPQGWYHFPYTTGLITTGRDSPNLAIPPKFTFRFGYFEMQAKMPWGQGLWPAFWLVPADHTVRADEIDIVEHLGHQPNIAHVHVHWADDTGAHQEDGIGWEGPDLTQEFHTFAADWKPDRIIWYVDGEEIWRFEDAQYVPKEEMYLIINLAVDGERWPGPPDETTPFPSYFEVDYVRVWQSKPS